MDRVARRRVGEAPRLVASNGSRAVVGQVAARGCEQETKKAVKWKSSTSQRERWRRASAGVVSGGDAAVVRRLSETKTEQHRLIGVQETETKREKEKNEGEEEGVTGRKGRLAVVRWS